MINNFLINFEEKQVALEMRGGNQNNQSQFQMGASSILENPFGALTGNSNSANG